MTIQRFFKIYGVLAVLFLLLVSCSPDSDDEQAGQTEVDESPTYPQMDPGLYPLTVNETVELLDSYPDVRVVDVRSREEFDQGHIAGSLFLPFAEIKEVRADVPSAKVPIILVGAPGNTGYGAALYLYNYRARVAFSLIGGIPAWQEAGLPLEKTAVEQK